MTDLTTTSHRLQGIDLTVRRKGRGPSMLVLHGGGGPVLGFPFADRLAERFELIEPSIRALPARRSRITSTVSKTSSISISI